MPEVSGNGALEGNALGRARLVVPVLRDLGDAKGEEGVLMTYYRRSNELSCDEPGCHAAFKVGGNETLQSARERAALKHWTTRSPVGRPVDFCPKHKR